MSDVILKVEGLTIAFSNKKESFKAVENIGFELKKGEILGIVGESGSGKTITSKAILNLLPDNAGVSEGSISFLGRELAGLTEKEMEKIRGTEIAMIFQDSKMALDQVYTVGSQITEAILTHEDISRDAAKKRALTLLESVKIPNATRVFDSYPFELSGGMCQRVMIAIALSCSPKILIADEPTTALDVTVQSQILDLLKEIQRVTSMGILLITHDLGVISEVADRVIVMYAGKIMEASTKTELLENPVHPYTRGLIRSMLKMDTDLEVLYSIDGVVPDIKSMPEGCRFSTRCPLVMERCRKEDPGIISVSPGHLVSCFRSEEIVRGEALE
ncbi:ABC transporter ATP-binding protein [Youngiibacter multivorans]|uniref:Oligopeptide/dipeptide ABC transporter ATP-binding protein n=1 Tax=Youngiibacter multivorans TaxID=937251 RepID=A0ABS4G839_9CLOT|nr:ABC transporter ATP-binding protein [Youngiibacter multivorans]MBP1920699.1 oligopeptide/dipeptide ABC transporter ATP-binding protein [Youngiibacter multivorans]